MKAARTRSAWWAALCLLAAAPAAAAPGGPEVSACQSAVGTTVQERIADLTTCIRRGHNGASFNGYLYVLRGASYAEAGDMDNALKDYGSAIELTPDDDVAFDLRGRLLANRGDWSGAQAEFEKAIKRMASRRNSAAFLADQAWLFATWPDSAMRDGRKAVTLALKATKLHDSLYGHDALAAAYAETGQFENAVREEAAAISGLRGASEDIVLAGYKARLALYQAKMAYHTKLPFPIAPRVDLARSTVDLR